MRFSIRTLLALITLAALSMLAFQIRRAGMESAARLSQLESEIDTLTGALQILDPESQVSQTTIADRQADLRENRDRCEDALLGLIEKYSAIEIREPELVSLRSYPTLKDESSTNHLAFRVVIPTERSVWIKLGFHLGHRESLYDNLEGVESKLLREGPFEVVGPLEVQIPPGVHVIALEASEPQDDQVVVRLQLNEQVLTQFKNTPDVKADVVGSMSVSARKQIDYRRKSALPNLMTLRINVLENPQSVETEYSLSCWFSDHSSSFETMTIDD